MRIDIHWTIFLEVTTPYKCEKLIDQIAQTLAHEIFNIKIEKYWKDETKFKATARSSIDVPNEKDGLYEIMVRLGRLARSWLVNCPVEDGQWSLSGTTPADSIRIGGVSWISFDSSSDVDSKLSPDLRTGEPIAVGSAP